MQKEHQWRTREEWAKDRRAFYHDRFEELGLSPHLSAYASPEEIEALIAALRALWKSEGARLRALHVPTELSRQSKESYGAFWIRLDETPGARDLLAAVDAHKDCRKFINETIKLLSKGDLPKWRQVEFRYLLEDAKVNAILGPIQARYDAAKEAATEKRKQEILATPIDDQAWDKELKRRASIERGPLIIYNN